MTTQNIIKIKIEDLNLWTENPRDPMNTEDKDYDIIKKAIQNDKSKWNLPKLVKEMGKHYDFSEIPTVVEINGKFIVFDGNRRLGVLKYLQNQQLYSDLGGGLFIQSEPKELRELKEIPCNVCDKETALINIERKHINSGSWGPLEREYFLHIHRGSEKSLFLRFEEQTGIISQTPKMNQRFVKEEVLTEKNLNQIGIHFDKDKGLLTNYSEEKTNDIIENIVAIVVDKKIHTRGPNRGMLKNTLLEEFPNLKGTLNEFDNTKEKHVLDTKNIRTGPITTRKTPKTKSQDMLFGRVLSLQRGEVNDLYLAISKIYEQNKNNENNLELILPILGMSLRLLLDIAARKYFEDKPVTIKRDSLYKEFLKIAREAMNQKSNNFVSLTGDWISKNHNLDGLLAKYAHGNITFNKVDVIKNSNIIADILDFYFKK